MPWFVVVAERFDWVKRRGLVVCYRPGDPCFGTTKCLKDGVAIGAIERIERPPEWMVGKDGVVRHE